MSRGMVIAIILSCLIIGGAIVYVNLPAFTTAVENAVPAADTVTVPDEMLVCQGEQACLAVDRSCGLCCDYAAINATQESAFDTLYNQTCRRYDGPYCECFDLSSYPTCEAGRCKLVPWPAAGP